MGRAISTAADVDNKKLQNFKIQFTYKINHVDVKTKLAALETNVSFLLAERRSLELLL